MWECAQGVGGNAGEFQMGSLRDEIDQLLVTDSLKRLSDAEEYGALNIPRTHDGNVSDDDPTLGKPLNALLELP
jgi:hypothetical protein